MNSLVCNKCFSVLFITLFLAFTYCAQPAEKDESQKTDRIGGHTLHRVLKPGEIPAIFNPEFIKVFRQDLSGHR